MIRNFKTGALFLFLFILITHTLAEGSCDANEESSERRNEVLYKHKVKAIPTILIVNTISFYIPIWGNEVPELRPGTNGFTLIKDFAGGALVSTGLTLVLPDAFESFNWNDNDIFTFELWAMIAAILIVLMDAFARSFYMSLSPLFLTMAVYSFFQDRDWSSLGNIMPLLGTAHSLIIGISTGLSTDLRTANLLLTALALHQYCEGVGVGEFTVIFNQVLRPWPKKLLLCSTLLAAPVGVGIGIGISSFFYDDQENSPKDIFDVVSVLILICRALVDLAALMCETPISAMLQFGARLSVSVVAGCVSLLAIWA